MLAQRLDCKFCPGHGVFSAGFRGTVQGQGGESGCLGGCVVGGCSVGPAFVYLSLFPLEKPLHNDVWARQQGKAGWIQASDFLKGIPEKARQRCTSVNR